MIGRAMAVAGCVSALVFAVLATMSLAAPAPVAPARAEELGPRSAPVTAPDARVARPQDVASVEAAGLAPTTPGPSPVIPGDGSRLSLRRLAIDLPLEEGDLARDIDQQATPSGAAFHLPGSARPGEPGNTYVYAHARPGQFLGLWNVRLGDVVEIVAPSGLRLTYRVTEIHPRVSTSDLSYLMQGGDERLTLQTSTGPRPGDPRFLVIALPVGRRE